MSDPVSALHNLRIGIIGAGAMGGALCRGLALADPRAPEHIAIYDPHAAHVDALRDALNVSVSNSNRDLARRSDIILLAVKPYMVAAILGEIADDLKRDNGTSLPLVISIAAGITIARLESHLTDTVPVIRAMPNTPSQVGKGACAYCKGTYADAAHLEQAAEIFQSVGIAVQVPEGMMDAVTALSGSGPAYIYLMIEALIDGGVRAGLPRDIASQLAVQTVSGAAQMVIETRMHPAQLRDMVTTPAGTTIEAIASLEHSGLRAALIDAVGKAAARSKELG